MEGSIRKYPSKKKYLKTSSIYNTGIKTIGSENTIQQSEISFTATHFENVKSTYNIKIIKKSKDFSDLHHQWNHIVASSNSCVCLKWEWLFSWYAVYGKHRRLLILLVYNKEELVGIAPFTKRLVLHFGFIPLKHISFISTPTENRSTKSIFLDLISKEGEERFVQQSIHNYLNRNRSSWDILELQELPSRSVHLLPLENLFSSSDLTFTRRLSNTYHYIRLPSTSVQFLNQLPTEYLSSIINFPSTYSSLNGYEKSVSTNPASVLKNYNEYSTIFLKCWKHNSHISDKLKQFDSKLLNISSKDEVLSIVLKLQGKIIAGILCLLYNKKMYLHHYCSDPQMPLSSSLGGQIIYLAIEYAITNGFKEFVFLPNSIYLNKSDISTSIHNVYDVNVISRKPLTTLLKSIKSYLKKS